MISSGTGSWGLGSGDLHVKTGGPSNLNFDLSNVLFVGWKLAKIQDMLREKEVTERVARNRAGAMVLAGARVATDTAAPTSR